MYEPSSTRVEQNTFLMVPVNFATSELPVLHQYMLFCNFFWIFEWVLKARFQEHLDL